MPGSLQKRLVFSLAAVLAAVVIWVFLPVRTFAFLNWDDQSYVTENDHIRGGVTSAGITWAFTRSHSANWHPLTWISHMLDCELYGLQPGGHHLTNVLFHAANTTLLFLLLRLMTGSIWRSAFVAALFALHPLRVESVAWVAERKDVLSTFFGLLSLMAYIHYAQFKMATAPVNQRTRFWYIMALICLALGLMSKPMLVTWPCVMLLLDFWPLRRLDLSANNNRLTTFKRLTIEKLPFFALALASCAVTILSQKESGAVATLDHISFSARLQNAAVAYIAYLANFFWPENLSPIYPLAAGTLVWKAMASVVVLLLTTVCAWFARKRFPYLFTGWLWFMGTLVPVIGLVQVGSAAHADRYTYVPEIGLAIALVWIAHAAIVRFRVPLAVTSACVGLALLALGWRTTEQLKVWQNTETLFGQTLRLYSDCVPALYGLGGYLHENGRINDAKPMLEKVIQLQPTFANGWGTLADLYDSEGNQAEAIRCYRSALKIQADHPTALNNLAWILASSPDPALRDGQEAIRLATKACELTGFSKPMFVGTLAAAQAEAGDFQGAIASAERAATLATTLRLDELAKRNQAMIELYRQGKAAHGGPPKTQ